MAGMRVTVHPGFVFDFGPVSRFVPPHVQVQQNGDPGGGQPSEPNALTFADPDGEIHVYVLADEAKRNLVAMLTGGIVLPGAEAA